MRHGLAAAARTGPSSRLSLVGIVGAKLENAYRAMRHTEHVYRAFHLGPRGEIRRFDDIKAEDDQGAMEAMRGIDALYGLEIWDGDRLVGMVEPSVRSMRSKP